MGIRGFTREPTLLQQCVENLFESSPTNSFLSAEAFCYALLGAPQREILEHLADAFSVEPVVTIRPDDERLAAYAQEMIKGGNTADFPQCWLPAIDSLPMRHTLVRVLLGVGLWAHAHIVLVNPRTPDGLFTSFERILGCRLPNIPALSVR